MAAKKKVAKKAVKKAKKKVVKKSARAAVKKSASAKKGKTKKVKKSKAPKRKKSILAKALSKPVGKVNHFYSHISVAIVKVAKGNEISVGEVLHFKGHTTDFKHPVSSMQYFHEPIAKAKAGQEVGIKVKGKTREGDKVYKI